MKLRQLIILSVLSASAARADEAPPAPPPVAPVRSVTDTYFGIKIVDPYRYMENLADPKVHDWIKSQADYTRAVLDRIPGRAPLLADIHKFVNATPASVRSIERLAGGKYFYLKTLASQNVAKLYMRQGLDGQETLLVDTDLFAAPNGAPAAINFYEPSPDGKLVAYGVSQGGSEIGALRVRNVQTRKDTGEIIDRVWDGEVSWRPDHQSFFFQRMQKLEKDSSPLELEQRSKCYLHVVGQSPDTDIPVLGIGLSPNVPIAPVDMPSVVTQVGSDYAIAVIQHGVQREITLYAAPLADVGRDTPWTKLCDVDANVAWFEVYRSDLFLLSHQDASRFKILQTSLDHPDVAHAACIVPEGPGVLGGLTAAADALYATERDGGVIHILRVPYGGAPQPLKLPYEASAGVFGADPRVPGVVLSLTAWTRAAKIFEYDPQDKQVRPTDLQPAGPFDQPPDLVSREVNVTSYDGAQVPLSIIMRGQTKLDGSNPTELVGYGAYGITEDPGFNPGNLAWFNRGGILAVAHVRGGGERGEQWHQAGFKLTKPNTWRDVIACAQYLIDQKYTSAKYLAVAGGSAGGITVGRTITERPDLFAAASIRSGLTNALRAENSANGVENVQEFGSVATQEGFEDLWAMDSYQHVRDGVAYPAVLLATGMNDPRVAPWESAEMAARLQAATSSGKPILLRIDYAGGHGIGASKRQSEELSADTLSFFLWQFGVPEFQPGRKSTNLAPF
jgi:prolyl oligopeptidase